jgi:ubiquinone/menaquinone biosynthesis C-methylase UbiE
MDSTPNPTSSLPEKGLRPMTTWGGDKTERWRESYSRAPKNLMRDSQSTNRARLARLGVDRLPRSSRILDVGTGDGNLCATLQELGFKVLWGLEYQSELLAEHPSRDRVVVASATNIPFPTATMDGVIVMDVLHHLSQMELPYCFTEIRRVLRTGGTLHICEPADTRTRALLMVLLMSPMSNLTRFSRDKRIMVEQERDTLVPWLESEQEVPARIMQSGFRMEFSRRYWLHLYARFRAV